MNEPSRAAQVYLKAIHDAGGADRQVSPSAVAQALGVAWPSVRSMLKRLANAGWVRIEPGKGVRLTRTGIVEARRVIRRHRLAELLLTRVLGLDWSEVDAEAQGLVHAISPRLEQALAAHLGEPQEDPHGHPIPTPEGKLVSRELRPLNTFKAGQVVTIREVLATSPERLRRWQEAGLLPGVIIEIVSCQPLDDIFGIRVGNHTIYIGSSGLVGLLGEEFKKPPGA